MSQTKEPQMCTACWGSGWEVQFSTPCKECSGTGVHKETGAHSFTESAYKEASQFVSTCGGQYENGLCIKCGRPPLFTGTLTRCGRWEVSYVKWESSKPQDKTVYQKALDRVPQSIKDQIDWDHDAIKEAWDIWEKITEPSAVNPHAFAYGYLAAKKKYTTAPSESQDELWKELFTHFNGPDEELLKRFTITRNP